MTDEEEEQEEEWWLERQEEANATFQIMKKVAMEKAIDPYPEETRKMILQSLQRRWEEEHADNPYMRHQRWI